MIKNKNKKHGFTLVELLVVIAILAILASVSVVGYLSFTTRARNSNAVTELTQAKEIIRAEFINESEHHYYVSQGESALKIEENNNQYNLTFTYNASDTASQKTFTYDVDNRSGLAKGESGASAVTITSTWDSIFKTTFAELSTLGGTFYVKGDTTITSIVYKSSTNGYAVWTMSNDEISTGSEGDVVAENTVSITTKEAGDAA